MDYQLYKTAEFVYNIGLANVAVLAVIALLLLFSFLYIGIVIESYSSLGTIKDIVSFGKYKVDMEFDGDKKEAIIIKAWNRANAVERVAKKLDAVDGVTFTTKKL